MIIKNDNVSKVFQSVSGKREALYYPYFIAIRSQVRADEVIENQRTADSLTLHIKLLIKPNVKIKPFARTAYIDICYFPTHHIPLVRNFQQQITNFWK